ncbi:alpha/beta hydrolase family protein [Rhodococcus xishaensis]|uniref:Alpha/beta fold hydrolase n=1 Tax=Rhodococcus xishaensis TaxID=2487364 RepID=A0A3S3A530_9NOCA|nr:alpha/beta fold hydrolase [Rhodococcus xishaensis]RVW02189.1 alpha/beta fold hydrolase [Rhodococcus xishaensis]
MTAQDETFDIDTGGVQGYLHRPAGEAVGKLVLTHGAGGDLNGKLLHAMASGFARQGFLVLRYNLPFRQQRAAGPPNRARAGEDRDGIVAAADAIRDLAGGPTILAGTSYGGRQSTMLAAERPDVADGLVLLSYPLHAPGKPEKQRTEHLPQLRTPSLFVHGDRDPFGTPDEIRAALDLIPAEHRLILVEGGRHGLEPERGDVVDRTVATALDLFAIR